jgi:uncharacterized protein with LGFP repeats
VAIDCIYRKWQALGGGAGVLGESLGSAEQVPWTDGYYARYEHGRIFWRPGVGPCAVLFAHPIYNYWMRLGGPTGPLGFPTSDQRLDDAAGLDQHFENGLIHWDAERETTTHLTGAHWSHHEGISTGWHPRLPTRPSGDKPEPTTSADLSARIDV